MKKVVKHEICERMRRIAVGRQITVAELSRRTGFSHGHIWNIFSGHIRCPLFSTVARIVTALDADDMSIVEQEQKSPKLRLVRSSRVA